MKKLFAVLLVVVALSACEGDTTYYQTIIAPCDSVQTDCGDCGDRDHDHDHGGHH